MNAIDNRLFKLLNQTRPSLNDKTVQWFEQYLTEQLRVPFYADTANNFYLSLGNNPRHCYTSHYDTVHSRFEKNAVRYNKNTGIISTVSKKGATPLGADDASGIFIMLELIANNTSGHYVFFADEERGGIGSGKFDIMAAFGEVDLILSLDRANTDEVIISQGVGDCASVDCGQWLASQLNGTNKTFDYDISYLGTFTDSANFADIVPECLNLSVGYFDQHTHRETQDYKHLLKLIESLKAIDLSLAPIVRKAGDYGEPAWSRYGLNWDRWDIGVGTYKKPTLADYVKENYRTVADYLEQVGIDQYEIESSIYRGDIAI